MSAEVERIFSSAKQTITARRAPLKVETVEALALGCGDQHQSRVARELGRGAVMADEFVQFRDFLVYGLPPKQPALDFRSPNSPPGCFISPDPPDAASPAGWLLVWSNRYCCGKGGGFDNVYIR
jgi:hypothetical protein